MDEIRQWLPIVVIIIANIVTITLAFASLRQKIAVSDAITAEKFKNVEEKIVAKFDILAGQVGEIKENHLHELKDCLEKLTTSFTNHLITHNKKDV